MTFLGAFFETFRAVVRDRAAVMTLILAIVLYSFFYPSAYEHEVTTEVPLAVADLDNTALSRKLTMAAAATQGVRLAARTGSLDEAKNLLLGGKVDAILWIAPGFERDVLRGSHGEIALLANGAYLVRTRATLNALSGAITDAAGKAMRMRVAGTGVPAAMPVKLIQRPIFNTREGYGSAIVPGVFMLIVQQTLLLGIGVLLVGWRANTRRKTSAPAFFGAAAALMTLGCLNMLYFGGMSLWIQDYPRGGNIAGLIVAAMIYVAAVVAMGLLLGSFFTRRDQSGQFLLGTSLPFFFLSGLSWPHEAAPPALVWLADLFPTTSGMQAFVKLTQMGARLDDIAPELTILAGLALAFGIAAYFRLCGRGRT